MLRDQSRLKSTVDGFEAQRKAAEDAGVLIELADEAKDEATAVEAGTTLAGAEEAVGKMEFARMLSGPYDRNGALVSINAGAGGTESQDWAEMLMRMFIRWGERKGFKLEELDRQPGDEAGIKSATIGMEGEWAYGWLRAEAANDQHAINWNAPFERSETRGSNAMPSASTRSNSSCSLSRSIARAWIAVAPRASARRPSSTASATALADAAASAGKLAA